MTKKISSLKIIFSIFVLLIVLGTACGPGRIAGYLSGTSVSNVLPVEYRSYRAQIEANDLILKASGHVECIKEYSVTVPDKIWNSKIEKMTEEGTMVKSGEVICKLNTRQIEENLNRALSELANTEAELDELKNNNCLEEITKKTDISKKILEYEVNLFKLIEMKKGADTIDVEVSKIGIEKNQAFISNFKSKLKSQSELLKQGFLSSFQFEEMQLEYQKNQLELEQNQNKLDILKQTPSAEEIKKLEMLTKKYDMDLELARKDYGTFFKVNRIEEEKKSLDINQRKHRVKLEQASVESASVTATIDGTLLYATTWRGKTHVGMEVWPGMVILKIVDFSNMKIIARVNEKYIDRIAENNSVEITLSAVPNRKFGGYIKSISKLAKLKDENDPKGQKEFDITVYFGDTLDVRLLPNMSADVKIVCGNFKNTCKIPKDFIIEDSLKSLEPETKTLSIKRRKKINPPALSMAAPAVVNAVENKGQPDPSGIENQNGGKKRQAKGEKGSKEDSDERKERRKKEKANNEGNAANAAEQKPVPSGPSTTEIEAAKKAFETENAAIEKEMASYNYSNGNLPIINEDNDFYYVGGAPENLVVEIPENIKQETSENEIRKK